MLKRNSKISNATKTTKSKELSEKTMGKIVGGINGFDEVEEDEEVDMIVDELVEQQDRFRSSYTAYRNKKNTDRDSFIVDRKEREHHRKPIAIVNRKGKNVKRGKIR